jgi:hypothetical protein
LLSGDPTGTIGLSGEEVAVPRPSTSQPYVVRFVGGPLDGRVDTLDRLRAEPLGTVTHVHLNDGPKIVHHYDLQYAVEYGCEYRVRSAE